MTLSRLSDLLLMCAAVSVVSFWAVGPAKAQEDLSSDPFTVFVAYEKAFTRCGPSDEHYRTDALRHGQQLDVYLETDNGWLGVRPPESSFCWVPASAVEIAKGGETAIISEDRTVSWIGTHLGRARQYRWQVQMAEGEQVTILGRSERDGPDGPQTWLRIVPPSGEFRWVHRDQVVDSAEELVAGLQQQPTADEQRLMATNELADERSEPQASGLSTTIVQAANSNKQGLYNDSATGSSRRRPAGSLNRKPTLAISNETPILREAPSPTREPVTEEIVGSGLDEQWDTDGQGVPIHQPTADAIAQFKNVQSNNVQTNRAEAVQAPAVADASVAASTEFIGRPRLLDIGANTAAPQNNVTAGDSNWVIGAGRMTTTKTETDQHGVRPAAFQDRMSQGARQARTIPAESINRIASEVRDADVESLQLLLSRLMANSASAAEAEPIVARARNLSMTTQDSVAAGRARLVAERAQQYQGVARRRDGNMVIRETGIPVIPGSGELQRDAKSPGIVSADRAGEMQTGYLVQVYSARHNSPPFALTDHAGNTVAYVTPSPGINLRGHLNSHIKVIGNRGFLQGLNMPHILVSQAARTPE